VTAGIGAPRARVRWGRSGSVLNLGEHRSLSHPTPAGLDLDGRCRTAHDSPAQFESHFACCDQYPWTAVGISLTGELPEWIGQLPVYLIGFLLLFQDLCSKVD
jgi:hypothetical protein